MIGQPTGTSVKFANHCAQAIRRWANSHGCGDCEIEKVALEGEGKIGERVENLWKLLLNWIEQLRKADLIIVACHSQGVPVGIMLLAKVCFLQPPFFRIFPVETLFLCRSAIRPKKYTYISSTAHRTGNYNVGQNWCLCHGYVRSFRIAIPETSG
jgi:hypothetical protein